MESGTCLPLHSTSDSEQRFCSIRSICKHHQQVRRLCWHRKAYSVQLQLCQVMHVLSMLIALEGQHVILSRLNRKELTKTDLSAQSPWQQRQKLARLLPKPFLAESLQHLPATQPGRPAKTKSTFWASSYIWSICLSCMHQKALCQKTLVLLSRAHNSSCWWLPWLTIQFARMPLVNACT